MLPATNRITGGCFAFPDVCLTPTPIGPIPIPYPNLALNMVAITFALNVLITGGNAFNMASIIALSMGDEPGVAHYSFKGPAMFAMGWPKVIISGTPGICFCPTFQNLFNTVGVHIIPSVTNVFYMLAPSASDGERCKDGLSEALSIEETLSGREREIAYSLLPGNIGYIELRVFSGGAPARVHGALAALSAQGMETLIIDLRSNPGGEVIAAIELAGDFLAKGSVIATLIDGDGDETIYKAHGESPYEVPVVLLVDRGTASASELFVAALRAHGRAVILGEATYGKGVAQAFVPRPEGSTYEAVARVVFPDGTQLHGAGIQPDIEIDLADARTRA